MKSIMSVESNDRRMNSSDNSIRSDYNEIVGKSVGENGRCEGRLPNTLTHSLTLSHIPSLTIIVILHHIYNLDNHNFDDDH